MLFVCLGNICRSPAADGVFSAMLEKSAGTESLSCDSCGTGDWHIGQLPDARMRAAGTRRGYKFTHRARQLRREDFEKFDLILAMDDENLRDIRERAPAGTEFSKIRKFTDFCAGNFAARTFVPDPYYGGEKDFELALDIIENGCAGLLAELEKQANSAL